MNHRVTVNSVVMFSELRHHAPRGLLCPFSVLVCGYSVLNICAAPAQPSPSLLCTLCRKLQGLWSLDFKRLLPGSVPQVTRGLATINQAWDPNPTDREASLLGHACLHLSLGKHPSAGSVPLPSLPPSPPPPNAHRSPVELFLHTCPREMETCPHTDWHTNIHSIWSHKCPRLEAIHVPTT